MTPKSCNAFRAALPATSRVVRWGGAEVWKVGSRVFAVGGRRVAESRVFGIACGTSRPTFGVVTHQPGLRPAPYLPAPGFTWIRHHRRPGPSTPDLKARLRVSHRLVALCRSGRARRKPGPDDGAAEVSGADVGRPAGRR